jgi:predicted ATPase
MISKISIQNFKSFENAEIECSNLNIMTGLNGMGKSSIIQALLLLRQSQESGFLQKEGLSLRGGLVDIGTGKDALYEFAEKEEINFSIDFINEGDITTEDWIFAYEANEEGEEYRYSGSDIMPYSPYLEGKTPPKDLSKYSLFKYDKFKYLHADRWVKNQYEVSDFQVVRNRTLGKHGEYTAHYIAYYGSRVDEHVNDLLLYTGTTEKSLEYQVSAWMHEISPNTTVIAERIKGSDLAKLRYIFKGKDRSSTEISPLNVGFGITYALPVLVALLNAKSGDILIIENPESHIHPKGQSALGKLIAKVASLNVQIFIETHSDHIINGILVAIHQHSKNLEEAVTADKVKINFITRKDDAFTSKNVPVAVLENGRLKGAPRDFFDQYVKDMKTIIGF